VQHAHAQPVVHKRVEELHRPLDGLDEDEQRRPQPLAHHLAQRDELAVLAPAEDERLLHRVRRRVLHEAARRNNKAGRVGGAVTVRGGGR